MRNRTSLIIALISAFLLMIAGDADATFSIVAVDTSNGAIGSAGASCIADAQIIEGVVESVGAINTQSWWNELNQQRADSLLQLGLTPDSILNWLYAHDAQGIPERRQYGIVTLAGPGSSAAFTGTMNGNWHGHLTGFGYSVQGNILLGPEIVEQIESAFLATSGPLEERLMAALEAADVPGADTRCLSCDKPAISAFIKVVHPGDGETPYLYEVINDTPCEQDPIPLLRQEFDLWKALKWADADTSIVSADPVLLLANGSSTSTITIMPLNWNHETPSEINEIAIAHSGQGALSAVNDNGGGQFSAIVTSPTVPGVDTFTITVHAGGEAVKLATRPVIQYYLCGDTDGNGIVNISDAVYLISYIFGGGPAPEPLLSGDADCNEIVNISDAVYLIAYIFGGGPAPCELCG